MHVTWRAFAAIAFSILLVLAPIGTSTAAATNTTQNIDTLSQEFADSATTSQSSDDPPEAPEAYYGNVTVNGDPAPANTTIHAVINGSIVGQITIDEAGQYGGPKASDEKLLANGSENGSTVRFYVGGLEANQTDSFESATTTELNLAFTDTEQPVADAGPDRRTLVGESLTYSATNSSDDGQILTYEWDFDGDGEIERTGENVSYAYTENGTKTVTLTVTDVAGKTDTDTATVNVGERENPPDASFEYSPSSPTVADDITFESTSTDNGTIESTEWDFDDGNTASGETVTHNYRLPGTYNVTVTVTDDDGFKDRAYKVIEVDKAVRDLTATPTPAYVNATPVDFTLQNTDGINADQYEWDFDNDGTTDVTTENPSVTHIYSKAGSFDASVTGTIDGKPVVTGSQSVTVEAVDGTVTADPDSGIKNYTSITLDAVPDTSVNQSNLDYEWTFSDGTTNTTASNETSHVFREAGELTVSVRAVGPTGDTVFQNTTNVSITAATGTLSASPTNATANVTEVDFTATTTTEGVTPTSFAWDFDNDDTFENVTEANQTNHVFSKNGSFDSTVQARSNHGVLYTAEVTVVVTQPDVTLTASPTSGYVNATPVDLNLVDLADDIRAEVDHYEWTFSDGATNETATNSTTHVFTEAGTERATVQGVDENGNLLFEAATQVAIDRASGDLEHSPDTIRANVTTATFTATNITPGAKEHVETYAWNFGDGTTVRTSDNSRDHTYESSGSYTVTVVGLNESGGVIFTTQQTVEVLTEGEPTAAFTWTPNQPTLGETVEFDASASTDNDPIQKFEWDFDNDGNTEARGKTVNHSFNETIGEHTVTLTVTDQDGLTNTTQHTLTVVRADGDLEASPSQGYANWTSISLQLTNVTSDIDTDTYRWEFGDGTFSNTSTNTTTHTYERPGTYTANVTAYNDEGQRQVIESTTVTITRADGDFASAPETVYANYTYVNFDLSNVTSGVDPAEYEWDFDGDGTTDETTVERAAANRYGQPGTYTAQVTALNDDGDVLFTKTTTVTVNRAAGNLTATPTPALSNVTDVTFNVTNVTTGVTVDSYEWDFDDGTTETTTNNNTSHVFEQPGTYTVSVDAKSSDGLRLFTLETNVTVVQSDVSVSFDVPEDQRIQDGVYANVTLTNERDVRIEDVTVYVDAQGDYWYKRNYQTSTTLGPVTLNASESKNLSWNITTWAHEELDPYSYYSGRIDLDAVADPNDEIPEANEDNNRADADTVATFTDIETNVYTTWRGVIDEPHEVTVYVENEGSADATQDHNVTVRFGDGTTKNLTVNASNLEAGERNRYEFTHTFTSRGDYDVTAIAEDDPFYPRNNVSDDHTRIRPFQLDVDYISMPYRVENGTTFRVYTRYDTNLETDVNLTIDLPAGLELVDGESKTKQDRSSRWGGAVSWQVKATQPGDNLRVNVSAEARDKSDYRVDTVDVIVPKIRVTDESAVVLNDSAGSNANTQSSHTEEIEIRNETTYDHEIQLSIQAGFEGRTLQGLEYLFDYPYGCVEQTTSPMLAALHTDQYYRDRAAPGSYDRDKVNKSVAIGVERLATGDNAQHETGAWSMWGDDPDGDRFYTMYALFGTASIRNDEVYGDTSNTGVAGGIIGTHDTQNVSTSLAAIDFNDTVHWINDTQESSGAIESDGYFLDDDPSMTGYTLVALATAGPYNSTTEPVATEVRQDAVRYLIEAQAANGSWNDDNAKSTAIAVWGLQTAIDAGLDDPELESQAQDAIDDGAAYLIRTQHDSGKWVEDRSSYWSSTGTTSQATAYSLLALNSTGLTAENESIAAGGQYLVGVYDDQGSWGFTEATAISIRALQEIGQGLGSVDRNVTVEIKYKNGTTALTKEVTVNDSQSKVTLTLTKDEREKLRQGAVTKTMVVTATGNGTVVTAIRNEQLVNEEEYEATEQARANSNQPVSVLESTATTSGDGEIGTHAPPFTVSIDSVDRLEARDDQTLAITVTNNDDADLLNPVIELPIQGSIGANSTIDATAYSGTQVGTDSLLDDRRSEINNGTFTDGDAIFVFGRDIPAGETRTYTIDVDVSSPGDIDTQADVRPLYNESFNVRTSETLSATGLGTVRVDVVDAQDNDVPATIQVDGSDIATNAASASKEIPVGDHTVTATVDGTTRSIDVSLADFEEENITFVMADTVTDPLVVTRTTDLMTVKTGTAARITEQTASATAAERVRQTFEVDSSGGTMVVAVNETVERAFRTNGTQPSIQLTGTNASLVSYTEASGDDPAELKIESDGDVTMNLTYTGGKLGNVDGDSSVTRSDASTIAKAMAKDNAVGEYADVNNDGQVTVVDAMMIAQFKNGTRDADYEVVSA